jgi:hypothetical protein
VGGRRYIYRAKVTSPIPAVGAPEGTERHRQSADTGSKVGRATRFGCRHGLREGFAAGAYRLSRARGHSSALAWPDGGDAAADWPISRFRLRPLSLRSGGAAADMARHAAGQSTRRTVATERRPPVGMSVALRVSRIHGGRRKSAPLRGCWRVGLRPRPPRSQPRTNWNAASLRCGTRSPRSSLCCGARRTHAARD